MTTEKTYAVLALDAYAAKRLNKPLLPANWEEISNQADGTFGFSYSVYRNTVSNEIVISFRGTDGDFGDWATNLGLSLSQETQATEVYAQVLKDYGAAANITFTGHSFRWRFSGNNGSLVQSYCGCI
jgi:hypothetical protein